MTDRPVSASLEAELRELARQRGIVVWLDKEGSYTAFADALATSPADPLRTVPVTTFRGSYLETMLALEDLQDGVGMTPMVVHVPGHTEESIAETPLFELCRGGSRHRRARALPTLVRDAAHGAATPSEIEAFLVRLGLTLDSADAWLAEQSGELSGGYESDLGLLAAEALYDDMVTSRKLANRMDRSEMAQAVWRRAEVLLGLTVADRRRILQEPEEPLPPRNRTCAELANDVATARDGADNKANKAAEKRFGDIGKWLEELTAFIALVEQCAEKGPPPPDAKTTARAADARYIPDLDDGVMINSAALCGRCSSRSGKIRGSGGRSSPTPTARRTTTGPTSPPAASPIASTPSASWTRASQSPTATSRSTTRRRPTSGNCACRTRSAPTFTLDEVGSNDARAAFEGAQHEAVEELVTKEHLRRQRTQAKANGASATGAPEDGDALGA